jgi:hypothetical protein
MLATRTLTLIVITEPKGASRAISVGIEAQPNHAVKRFLHFRLQHVQIGLARAVVADFVLDVGGCGAVLFVVHQVVRIEIVPVDWGETVEDQAFEVWEGGKEGPDVRG